MLFNAWDPLHRNVVLYERTYEHHIVFRHGEDVSVEEIRFVVENPEFITADSSDNLVEIYYAKGVVRNADPSEYLKVCARYDGEGLKVVTAYLVDRPKPTERVLWPHKP